MNAQVNIEKPITAQTFIPALQFVSHAMAKNDTRFFLKGVLVKVRDNELILVGTDGHRMAHCKVSGSHSLPEGEYILPADFVKTVIKGFKPKKSDLFKFLALSFDLERFTISDGSGNQVSASPIDATYPDYNRVTPTEGEGTGTAAFNCLYLAEAFKACSFIANEKFHGVKYLLNGENSPAKIEVPTTNDNISDAYIVIMPMKV